MGGGGGGNGIFDSREYKFIKKEFSLGGNE